MRILLADGSTDQQLAIRAHLRETAHFMDVVDTGHLAVEAFKARRYDLVLIHMGVTVVRGEDAVRAMRAWEAQSGNTQIPIVGLVDRGPGLGELAVTAGCTVWLPRPVGAKHLFECLNGLRWPQNVVVWTGRGTEDRTKRIPVKVDPQLKDLIPSFLIKRGEDLVELKTALKANDLERIRLCGHRLKGKGAGYGFPGISKVGDALEHAVLLRDLFSIREAIDELESYLARVELVD